MPPFDLGRADNAKVIRYVKHLRDLFRGDTLPIEIFTNEETVLPAWSFHRMQLVEVSLVEAEGDWS